MSSHTLEGKKKTQNGVKRLAFTVLSILLEVVFLIGIFKGLNEYAVFIDNLTRIFAVILVLKIYGRNETSSMKTPWIILILTFPILGVALYFMIGMNGGTRKMRMRYKRIDEKLLPLLPENKEVLERLNVSDPKAGNVSNYIERNACYPVYQNTDVTYFDEAVKGLEAQLTDLAKAEQFIFMEYHAIEDEYAWSRIQTVLEERVKAGVEVRVFYDDMGSIGFVNLSFARKLEAKGIACRVFNPLLPGLNMFLNNRDHRKITVIDGKVGYTGGYNLANEYFNYTHPYGEWKDTGIRLEGDAVASLTAAIFGNVGSVREDFGRCGCSGYRGTEKISGTASVSGKADGIYPAVCGLPVRRNPGWRGCLYQYRQQSGQILLVHDSLSDHHG